MAVAQHDLVGGGEVLAQLGAAHLVQVSVKGVDLAELLEQLDGGLFAHPGHAGDVVGGVADERLVVDELLGRQAIALGDLRQPVGGRRGVRPARGVEHADVVVHQLKEVAIAAHDEHVDALGRRLFRKAADDVVRLEVGIGDDGDAEHSQQLFDALHLRPHIVGHRLARGLVGGEFGMAPGVAHVEGRDDEVWLELAQRQNELAGEAEDRAGRFAGAGRQRRLEGEIGAVGL